MAITEKLKGDLRETVENLKEEVSELKDKLVRMMPGRRERSLPVRSEARDALTQWRRETERMFEELWRGSMGHDMEWPRLDVEDRKNEILVTAEIPGIDDKDLDVRIDEERLTIRGEKRADGRSGRAGGYYRSECFYGSFERMIALPESIDRDRVEARFRKGILTLHLPKTAEARERARRIPVQAG